MSEHHLRVPRSDWIRVSYDAGADTAVAVYTPDTGRSVMIHDIIVSCSSATTVTLFFNTDTLANRIFRGYFAANQGAIPTDLDICVGPVNGVVRVTNTNPTASITLYGHLMD